ncbi:PREDICTED: DNA-binding protein RFX2 [Thamnophis sirtalis]|uniref:DNA-binding protein RFX2 n=1 Tax=Thamnophis sirtalis TaxID=35019 RepID=A0A6I9YD89_9SAUR|nr:PREDICTED: DNA-binding protein RFX2 [Thamnophis sirtalis]
MQTSEEASNSATPVALRTSASAQPGPASQQRVLVQATSSAPKGVPMPELTLPRAQQVQTVQHVYPAEVQYIEGGEAVYANGTLRATYTYNTEAQIYAPGSATAYFESQGGSAQVSPGASSPTAIPSHGMVGLALDSAGTSQIVTSSGTYLIHGGMENARHTLSHASRSSPATLEMAIENLQKNEGITSHKSTLLNSHLPFDFTWKMLKDKFNECGGGGGGATIPAIDRMAPGLDRMASSIDRLPSGLGHGIERSEMDRMGLVLDRMGSGVDRMGSGIDRMAPLGLDHLASSIDRMGPGMDRMGAGLGFGLDRMGSTLDRVGSAMDRMGSGVDRMGLGLDRMVPAGMGPVMDRMPAGLDRLGAAPMDRMGLDRLAAPMDRMGLDRMGAAATSMDRMGPALSQGMGAGLDRIGLPMGSTFERTMEMERGNFAAGNFTSALGTGGPVAAAGGIARKACQIFVRNGSPWAPPCPRLPTWGASRSLFPQVSVVSAFAQTLRRYTSLNHLAQAARAVLQNTSQINQMLSDLNRVDFANVQEQASWVCQCEEGLVQKLEQDFKATLQQQSSLDQWARWLDEVVTQVLKPHEGAASFPRAARQFLLKWSFYSSMVIRDLTLRSAASFGSFHLIRLLYDEYMFYLVEHRVAEATGETPIAVMGEFSDLASLSPAVLEKDAFGNLGLEAGARVKPRVKREHSDPGPSLQEI